MVLVNGPYGYSPTSYSAWPNLPFAGAAPGLMTPSSSPITPSPEQRFLQDLFLPSGATTQPFLGSSSALQALLVHELLQMLVEYFAQYFTPGQTGRDLGSMGASPTAQRVAPGSWGAGGGGSGGGGGGGGSPSGSVGTPSGTGSTPVPANVPTGRGTVGDFLQAALAQKGDRYRFGAETNLNDANPDTFDCSELVQWAAHQAGVNIADGSWNQKAACKPLSVEEALRTPGALLFKPGHVAISLGDGRTIEAMGTKWGVVVANGRGRFTSGGLIPGMQYG